MNGIIILDGPDACGKTTLQERIVETYVADKIHLTYPAPDNYKDMFEYQLLELLKAIEMSKSNLVVIDRHWISEMIYAKVFRGGSPWPYMPYVMDALCRFNGVLYILCLPGSIEEAVQRHRDNIDPAHPYDDDKFRELLTEYNDFYIKTGANRLDMLKYTIERNGDDMGRFAADAMKQLISIRKLVEAWK
jgi:thymidylate kinase